MGQLEKYGLYVLCLVIFLILGVTIWGAPASATMKAQDDNVAIRANALGTEAGRLANPNGPLVDQSDQLDLDWLLKPGARPPKPEPAGSAGPSKQSAGAIAGVIDPVVPVTKPARPTSRPVATTRKYKIRKGDTLGAIAQQQLGSTRHVGRIKDLNPGLHDRRLTIGKEILLPAGSAGSSAATRSASYRTYTISSGDSFERIARVELGDARRVKEVMKLNPNVDPYRLGPGKKIKLPLK